MQPLPTQVRRFRLAWALTQRELAELLGSVTGDSVSGYERLASMPGHEALIALELLFGAHAYDLFPAVGLSVVSAVLNSAVSMRDALKALSDAASARKRQFLDELIIRSTTILSAYDQ